MRSTSIGQDNVAPPLHLARCPRIFRAVATQLTCPSCRAEIPRGAAFCAACGSASPTVITDERAVVHSPSPEGRGGQGVRTTLERLARALGPKYEVKRLIGRGGFAAGYELWDKDLDRRLACKVHLGEAAPADQALHLVLDRKSTRLNSSH